MNTGLSAPITACLDIGVRQRGLCQQAASANALEARIDQGTVATASPVQFNTRSMRQRRQPRPHGGDPCGIEFGQHQAFAFGQHADHLARGIDHHAMAPGAAIVFEGVGVTRGSSLNTIQLRNLFSATSGSCTELS